MWAVAWNDLSPLSSCVPPPPSFHVGPQKSLQKELHLGHFCHLITWPHFAHFFSSPNSSLVRALILRERGSKKLRGQKENTLRSFSKRGVVTDLLTDCNHHSGGGGGGGAGGGSNTIRRNRAPWDKCCVCWCKRLSRGKKEKRRRN